MCCCVNKTFSQKMHFLVEKRGLKSNWISFFLYAFACKPIRPFFVHRVSDDKLLRKICILSSSDWPLFSIMLITLFFLILHEIFFKKHKKYFLFAPTSYIALIYLNDASKGKRIGCSSSVWILFLAFFDVSLSK